MKSLNSKVKVYDISCKSIVFMLHSFCNVDVNLSNDCSDEPLALPLGKETLSSRPWSNFQEILCSYHRVSTSSQRWLGYSRF